MLEPVEAFLAFRVSFWMVRARAITCTHASFFIGRSSRCRSAAIATRHSFGSPFLDGESVLCWHASTAIVKYLSYSGWSLQSGDGSSSLLNMPKRLCSRFTASSRSPSSLRRLSPGTEEALPFPSLLFFSADLWESAAVVLRLDLPPGR